jgi:hypothetical protein
MRKKPNDYMSKQCENNSQTETGKQMLGALNVKLNVVDGMQLRLRIGTAHPELEQSLETKPLGSTECPEIDCTVTERVKELLGPTLTR